MHSMSFQKSHSDFHSISPETLFSISLADSFNPVEMDYSENPNLVIEIEELRNVIGLKSATQAGILVNQDESCWITNLGKNGSLEVYRPRNKTYRKLAYNQVAYLCHGDYVGFYGSFYRLELTSATMYLVPLSEKKSPKV